MLHKVAKQNLDGTRVATSFRRRLNSYEQNAVVQREIATKLVDMLKAISQANQFDRALEFGSGTGFLTKQLVEQFQIKNLYTNDLVAECGPKIQAIDPKSTFIAGPVQDIELPAQLDLVVSSSAIQWITDLPTLLRSTAKCLNEGGWMALSGFGPDHFFELQELGSRAAAPSYVDPAEMEAILPASMEILRISMSKIQLEFDGLAPLLRHLRDTGVNAQANGLLNRANFKTFEQIYQSRFSRNGKLTLTYQPIWLVARRSK